MPKKPDGDEPSINVTGDAIEPYAGAGAPDLPEAPLYADGWDGTLSEFVLGHPIIQNGVETGRVTPGAAGLMVDGRFREQVVLREGTRVRYRVKNISPSGAAPEFIGPDAGHVADLYWRGMFAGTSPYGARERRQAAIDDERAVFESIAQGTDADGNPIMQPAMRSLAQLDGQRVHAQFAHMIGTGPADMRRRELQEARTDDDGRKFPGAAAPGSRRPGEG